MLKSILRLSLAILAIAALAGCAIERLTGPQVDVSGTDTRFVERESDPPPPPGSDESGGGLGVAADTLRAGGDDR